ncbi:MAG: hypothetical protein IT377_04955 [Polyangiaceae bacterium]|nr:hypothetical protein [Polyangiaceae bacterium]
MARRLPVIQSSDDGEPRSPAQWVAIAAALTLTLWVPIGMLAMALGRGLAARLAGAWAAAALVALAIGSLVLAAGATGAVVGRFGGRAGARAAVLGVSLATLGAWVATVSSGALAPWPVAALTLVVLGVVAAFGAALGARSGLRRRPTLGKNG